MQDKEIKIKILKAVKKIVKASGDYEMTEQNICSGIYNTSLISKKGGKKVISVNLKFEKGL
jgi:hypothetical protein